MGFAAKGQRVFRRPGAKAVRYTTPPGAKAVRYVKTVA